MDDLERDMRAVLGPADGWTLLFIAIAAIGAGGVVMILLGIW